MWHWNLYTVAIVTTQLQGGGGHEPTPHKLETVGGNKGPRSLAPPERPREMHANRQNQVWTLLEQYLWTHRKSILFILQKKERLRNIRPRTSHVAAMWREWSITSMGNG